MLEVRHLRLVRAIVEEGTITRAGERLHLTQSAVSCQLRELEALVGQRLFMRLPRRMAPTAAGDRLLRAARELLPSFEALEAELRGQTKLLPVRICTECYTVYHWLPAMITRLRSRHSNVDVEIVLEATHKPASALVAGTVDVAVMTRPGSSTNLQFRPLFEDEMVAVLAPGHPLASRDYLEAADLADEHVILYNISDEESSLLECIMRPAGVRPRRVSKVQLTEAILEMVRAGIGVGFMARWAVAPYLEDGRLTCVRVTKRGFRREWGVATLRGRAAPSHVRDFARLLVESALGAQPAKPGLSIVA